jgi:hypothetical protein
MSRLVALYPRPWRDRYEVEFLALLSERPPDPADRIDIVRGAIDARLHLHPDRASDRPTAEHGKARTRRRSGWLTLLGGVLWVSALVVAINGPIVTDTWGSYREGMAAAPLWFTALVLLGVGLATIAVQLPAGFGPARRAALIGGLLGLLWAFAPWLIGAGLVSTGCMVIVGVAAWRSGSWTRADAALLTASVLIAWSFVPLVASGLLPQTLDSIAPFMLALTPAWLAVGHALVRGVPGAPGFAVDSEPG